MQKKRFIIIIAFVVIIGLTTVELSTDKPEEIFVSAAASMQKSLDEIASNYEQETGNEVVLNYGGSGTLVTQIINGAPADIFISASQTNFDNLEKAVDILKADILVDNELVLIANQDSDINNLDEASKVAIGTPDAVPAGTYAMQVLENTGQIDSVESKLVQAKDVSEVLTYVETKNADLGFVYQTDAKSSNKVKVVETYDASLHDPIKYPMGLLTDKAEAKDFYDYLLGESAQEVLIKNGFTNHE